MKKKLLKILVFFMSLIMMFSSFIGCKGSGDPDPGENPGGNEQPGGDGGDGGNTGGDETPDDQPPLPTTGFNPQDGKYYDEDGELFTGKVEYLGKLYNVVDGVMTVTGGIYNDKVYNDKGRPLTGAYKFEDNKVYAVTEGVKGALYTGTYNDLYYQEGELFNGQKEIDGKIYGIVDGVATLFTGDYNEKYYKDGVLFTGKLFVAELLYDVVDGVKALYTGEYDGKYYEAGAEVQNGFYVEEGVLYEYKNGDKTAYTGEYQNKYYENGLVFTGVKKINNVVYDIVDGVMDLYTGAFEGMYYEDGSLMVEGYETVENVLYTIANGVMTAYTGVYESKYYENGLLHNGMATVEGILYEVENGEMEIFTGVYETKYYENGTVYTGMKEVESVLYNIASGVMTAYTGDYESKHYENGTVYTGKKVIDNILYDITDGVKAVYTGVYETKYYENGTVYTGKKEVDGKLYDIVSGVMTAHTGVYNGKYYDNGDLFTGTKVLNGILYNITSGAMTPYTGTHDSKYYVDGALANGEYNGNNYVDGVIDNSVTYEVISGVLNQVVGGNPSPYTGTYQNKYYENGLVHTGFKTLNNILYNIDAGVMTAYTGVYETKYYENGTVYTGMKEVESVLYDIASGVMTAYTGDYQNLYYENGLKFNGTKTIGGILYNITDGVKATFTGVYETKYYENGTLYSGRKEVDGVLYNISSGVMSAFTGNFNGKYYQNGVPATGVINNIYYENGVRYNGLKEVNGVLYEITNGRMETYYGEHDEKYYEDGLAYNGKKVLSGVLYDIVDGVKTAYTGVHDSKYYENGTVFSGTKVVDGVLYTITNGNMTTFSGDHENKYYENGLLFTGKKVLGDGKLYDIVSGVKTAYTGVYENKYYENGSAFSGKKVVDGILYDIVSGVMTAYTGDYNGTYYVNGVVSTGVSYVTEGGVLYQVNNGSKNPYTGVYENKYYENGILATGECDGKYYENGNLFTGKKELSGVLYDIVSGVKTAYTGEYDNKYYENGTGFTGMKELNGILYNIVSGVKIAYNGEYNGKNYVDGVEDTGSGGGTTDPDPDPGTGGGTGSSGKTQITFAYFAGEDEAAVLEAAIAWYNANDGERDGIYVTSNPKPGTSYVDYIETLVGTNKGPDLFLVGDRYIKRWSSASYPLLTNLDGYIEGDADMQASLDKMWASAVWRNQYDAANNTNNDDDPMVALPRDLSPTSLYYNQTMFEKHGIKCISVDREDIEAFNNGAPDRNGKTKDDYGITIDVLARGFQRDMMYEMDNSWYEPSYGSDGKIAENIIFNNRIAMSWDEVEDLGRIFTAKYNTALTSSDTTWGYYTEWWFSYGWGVGGDCLEDTTGNGDWTFTLGDKTKRKLVFNADGSYATDARGKALFLKESEWSTYQLGAGQYLGEVLPTQYEAFERFYNLGRPIEYGGLEIAMRQQADIGTSTAHRFFIDQRVAMIVQPSTVITAFNADCQFTWDVAPLPMYIEYADAWSDEIVNQGVQIGHSAETSIGVWSKSPNKEAAYKVAKYFSAGYAQDLQAQAGYFLPNDIEKAQTTYVNAWSGKSPKNISILTEIATLQQPADWWYMTSNDWIDEWATPLNTEYRESAYTVQQFFDAYTDATNAILATYKTN